MNPDWIWGFGGGLLIGLAASAYLLFNGKIMGITGIMGELVDGSGWGNWDDRVAFIAGLVLVPWGLSHFVDVSTHVTGNWVVLIVGGVLVGIGTRLSNGCTSGHGVCGMARLSPRSILATVTFVLTGGITMAVLRHVLGVI